jgi:hypothetical protein
MILKHTDGKEVQKGDLICHQEDKRSYIVDDWVAPKSPIGFGLVIVSLEPGGPFYDMRPSHFGLKWE